MSEDRPTAVPSSLYSEEIVVRFAGPDYRDFVESGGARLRPRLARSLELAKLSPGVRLLDLGCGRGEVTAHAALRGAHVVALDYSADCVRLTRETVALSRGVGGWGFEDGRRVRIGGTPSPQPSPRGRGSEPLPDPRPPTPDPQVVQADATALPFPAASFDRVTMLDVVEHLHPWQLEATFREVRRILKPDGFAVIHTVPNRWALEIGYPLLRLVRPSLPADPRTDYEHDVHINEQDLLGLARALRDAGLRSRVWLENLTLEQARWQQRSDAFPDVRGASYGFFRRPFVRQLTRLALRTPLKLIACNDIYAIARPR